MESTPVGTPRQADPAPSSSVLSQLRLTKLAARLRVQRRLLCEVPGFTPRSLRVDVPTAERRA